MNQIIKDIRDRTTVGLEAVMAAIGIIVLIAAAPLWAPFWLIGYLVDRKKTCT